jgi:hypothetical protein
MHGREENLKQNFEYLNEMCHSESLCEFGRIILEWNLTTGLWKNKTSNCYPTGIIFTYIFKIIFSALSVNVSCLDRVKGKNWF